MKIVNLQNMVQKVRNYYAHHRELDAAVGCSMYVFAIGSPMFPKFKEMSARHLARVFYDMLDAWLKGGVAKENVIIFTHDFLEYSFEDMVASFYRDLKKTA